MLFLAILLVGFVWLGLTADTFDRRVVARMLAIIAIAIAIVFVRGKI